MSSLRRNRAAAKERRYAKMKRLLTALLLLTLLCPFPGLGEENDEEFGTFSQPDGVEIYGVRDADLLEIPRGLEGLYALMADCNDYASAYLFRMPNGRALASVACTTLERGGTALELLEAWPEISARLSGLAKTVETTEEPQVRVVFEREALNVSLLLELADGSGVWAQAEGTAFYQGRDLIEVWSLYPVAETYRLSPLAQRELARDLESLKIVLESFEFHSGKEEAL